MNNSDERDYEEEAYNRALLEEQEDPPTEMIKIDWQEEVEMNYAVAETSQVSQEIEEAKKVIAHAQVAEVPQDWYFSFGYDHRDHVTGMRLRKRYCKVFGTYEEARGIITERFGQQWSMVYSHANDLPVELRIVNGRTLPPYKWRGVGVEAYGLELLDYRMLDAVTYEAALEDRREIDREKAGYYDPDVFDYVFDESE
jgi:hypothetical protein